MSDYKIQASGFVSPHAMAFAAPDGTAQYVSSAMPLPVSGTLTLGGAALATTQADGAIATLGAQADTVATSDGGAFSLIALTKRLLGKLPASLGQKPMAGALSVAIASDQSNVPVSGTVGLSGALPAGANAIGSVSVSNLPATQAVSAAALPLPAGAATAANQTSGNTTLSGILTACQAATPAGANLIGKVGIDQTTPGSTNAVYDQSYATHAPAYYQANVVASASTLSTLIGTAIPSWATMVFITPETGAIRYRADGTAPTSAIGQPVAQGQSWPLQGVATLAAAQFIASATTTVSIEFRG
jgi:hypothetical protein